MIGRFSQTVRSQIVTAEKKRCYNRNLFTRVAHEYDTATRVMSFNRDSAWKQRLVSMLPDMREPRCLDLACGTGDVTFLMGKRYLKGHVIGTDLTPAMLQVAGSRNDSSNVHFQAADMMNLPFADEVFDIVTGSYALRNAPDLCAALAETRRVLRPGGCAAFLDFARPANQHVFAIHRRVLRYWCGAASIAVHGRPEHTYIAESLGGFPALAELAARLEAAQLNIVRRESAMFGTMDLILCRAV